jgi:catechol 2,3-dioxygenase-like lactoylglutathione lyase family enzyme
VAALANARAMESAAHSHEDMKGRSPMSKRPVLTFSHVGIWVTDLEAMRRFYMDVLGFVETDRGPIGDTELVFLSQATSDHHQLVLAKGRPHDADFTTVNQISYKLDSLETLKAHEWPRWLHLGRKETA